MTGGTHKEEWQIEGAVERDNPSVFFSTISIEGCFSFHLQNCMLDLLCHLVLKDRN
jgi:hypothetical protein